MFAMRTLSALGLALSLGLTATAGAETTIRVLSDRTPAHLESLFKHYEQINGVKIEAVFVKKGLLARLKERPTEADLVITSTGDVLQEAKQEGLLRKYESKTIDATLAAEFRDPDDTYVTMNYRPRVIFASRERVKPGEVTGYADLVDPKWRGRVCVRSGYHEYNLSFLSQMAADKGLDATRSFIGGLKENLARTPNGNDRNQVRGIYEGVCDIALANSYYMPIMMSNPEQRPWGEATYVIFPDQDKGGAYVMRGTAGLTTAGDHVAEATKLLEYLVSKEGQEFVVNTTFDYPALAVVALPEAVRDLGKGQPGIEDGRFKARFIAMPQVTPQRDAVVTMLDEINFDSK